MSRVNILAVVSGLIGLVIGFRGLKSLRSQEHPQAEISF